MKRIAIPIEGGRDRDDTRLRLIAGRTKQIIISGGLTSEPDDYDGIADAISRAFLINRDEVIAAFATEGGRTDTVRWSESLARKIADMVISGPRLAAFVLAEAADGTIAATTRLDGRVGLPGGKLDPGETALQAALRESVEEGWRIEVQDRDPIHVQDVEGFRCAWFLGRDPVMLEDYAERGRIEPFWAQHSELTVSKLGNENAIPKMLALREEGPAVEP